MRSPGKCNNSTPKDHGRNAKRGCRGRDDRYNRCGRCGRQAAVFAGFAGKIHSRHREGTEKRALGLESPPECSRSRIPLLPPLPYLFFNPHPLKINQLCPVHSSGHPPACAVSDPSVLTDFQNHVIHPAKHAVDLWSTHLLRSTVLPGGSGRCACACGVGGSVSSGYQKRGCVQTGVPATSLIPCSDDYRKCVSEFRWQFDARFPQVSRVAGRLHNQVYSDERSPRQSVSSSLPPSLRSSGSSGALRSEVRARKLRRRLCRSY